MARTTVDSWLPEPHGGAVITTFGEYSGVDAWGRHEPMASDTKSVPRSGGMAFSGAIAKGAAYPEDASVNDEVILTARKLGKIVRLADEDIKDTQGAIDLIETKKLEWARVEAVGFDNAALGVSAAENGGTIPYTSVYKSLRTTQAGVSYTADDNRVPAGSTTAITYAKVSDTFGLIEAGNYFNEQDIVVFAHPLFRGLLRSVLDDQGNPILFDPQGAGGAVPTLFGAPVKWTRGARVHATATDSPTGNPLLIVANKQFLIVGDRSGPESMVAGADSGAAFATDEALLKLRTRKGFALGHPNAAAVLELAAT